MTPSRPLDPSVELRLGERRAALTLHGLAALLRVPVAEARGALLAHLLASPRTRDGAASQRPPSGPRAAPAPEGEGREGEGRRERFPTSPFPTSPNVTFPERNNIGNVTSRSVAPARADGVARRVADALGDAANLAAYEGLALRHPPERLLRALDVALRAPAGRLRGARGAYFMGVVANLARRPPDPHARPPSPEA